MSRISQKRTYHDLHAQDDYGFGDYGRLLNRQDLQYLHDGVPQPGFVHGRVHGVNFSNDIFRIELTMDDGLPLALRFDGEFAQRMLPMAGVGSKIRISTRGAVVEFTDPTTLWYKNGAHASVETVLNAWEAQGNQ